MKKNLFTACCLLIAALVFSQNNLKIYKELKSQGDSLYRKKEYKSAALSYSSLLRLPGVNLTVWDWDNTAFSWSAGGYPDSAFYCLNTIAGMDTLTFSDCDDVIGDPDFEILYSDKRWQKFKDKIFFNLYKKYIPENAFAKTRNSKKRLLIDGGHFNFHDIEGTYATLAGALQNCGFETLGHKEKFNSDNLKNVDLLIISNPLCDRQDSLVRRSQRDN